MQSFGIIYYFFENPAEIRDDLIQLVSHWSSCWSAPFTRISTTGDQFRTFPKEKSAPEFAAELIRLHDFDRSLFFTAINPLGDSPPSQRLLYWGRRIHEEFRSKTPNYVYFEVPSTVSLDRCWDLFTESIAICKWHLALGNRVIPENEERMPGSGAQAARQLRESNLFLHTFETSFRNLSYLNLLESRRTPFLMHPSQFIAIGAELLSGVRSPAFAEFKAMSDLRVESYGSSACLRADSDAGVVEMTRLLSSHFGDVGQPLMFWKPEEWQRWLGRVRGDSPGRLTIDE